VVPGATPASPHSAPGVLSGAASSRGAVLSRGAGSSRPATSTAPTLTKPAKPYGSGAVTRIGLPPSASVIAAGPPDLPDDPLARNRKLKRWFIAVAAAVVALGLFAVAALVMTGRTGGSGLFDRKLSGPSDTRPELAKRCPPPSEGPDTKKNIPPTPAGPRTVDKSAGISYAAYGAPWEPWDQAWSGGTLHVIYRVGQHFITEPGPSGEGYHASILSGSVPATDNDSMVLDLQCTGRLVAADVRTQYYYQPNTMELMRDEQTVIGGLPAWVTKFRLHFSHAGLKAKDELVAVVLVDVGRPEAAILYVSIPGTNREWDHVVDEVIDSVRPA